MVERGHVEGVGEDDLYGVRGRDVREDELRVGRLDDVVDKLNTAIKSYLTGLDPAAMGEPAAGRVTASCVARVHTDSADELNTRRANSFGLLPSASHERVRNIVASRREAVTWRRTVQVNTAQAYWSYLDRYPKGPNAPAARARPTGADALPRPPPPRCVTCRRSRLVDVAGHAALALLSAQTH